MEEAQEEMGMEWKPIESAPKDGRWILLAQYAGEILLASYAGEWMPDCECWGSHCGQYVVDTPEPTHWMLLPEPPHV